MVHDDDSPARPRHAPHFIEDAPRVWHDAHDVGSEHDVEPAVGKFQRRRVHLLQRFHLTQRLARDPVTRDLQHRRAEIDPRHASGLGQQAEFQPGADADHQRFAVRARRLARRARGGQAAGVERQVENQIVDRRPTAVGRIGRGGISELRAGRARSGHNVTLCLPGGA